MPVCPSSQASQHTSALSDVVIKTCSSLAANQPHVRYDLHLVQRTGFEPATYLRNIVLPIELPLNINARLSELSLFPTRLLRTM